MEIWNPCCIWNYIQQNSLITVKEIIRYLPESAYINNGPSWLSILSDYKKRPTYKDLQSIYYSYNPDESRGLFSQIYQEDERG